MEKPEKAAKQNQKLTPLAVSPRDGGNGGDWLLLLVVVIVPWLLSGLVVLLFAPLACLALGVCLGNYLVQVITSCSKALNVCDCILNNSVVSTPHLLRVAGCIDGTLNNSVSCWLMLVPQ